MKTSQLLLAALTVLPLGACHVESDGSGGKSVAVASSAPANGPWREFVRPADAELREQLSSLAYRVTQEAATERPFTSELNGNKEDGLYVDVVSGEPLFSSRDKFDSGTGWPSFTRPVTPDALSRRTDHELGYARTEVRSAVADSHLGHVFTDGPAPTGLRYCINGAALRFVPAAELEARGYGDLAPLFD